MDENIDTANPTIEVSSEGLTESQKANIASVYARLDLDESGTLSFKELRTGLQFLGLNPTRGDIKTLMKKYNIDGERKNVSYEEFETIMTEEVLKNTNAEFDILEAFRVFDTNKNGTLDKSELKRCLQSLGDETLGDEEVDFVFEHLDVDKDGKLSLIEASKLLTS